MWTPTSNVPSSNLFFSSFFFWHVLLGCRRVYSTHERASSRSRAVGGSIEITLWFRKSLLFLISSSGMIQGVGGRQSKTVVGKCEKSTLCSRSRASVWGSTFISIFPFGITEVNQIGNEEETIPSGPIWQRILPRGNWWLSSQESISAIKSWSWDPWTPKSVTNLGSDFFGNLPDDFLFIAFIFHFPDLEIRFTS